MHSLKLYVAVNPVGYLILRVVFVQPHIQTIYHCVEEAGYHPYCGPVLKGIYDPL